MPKIIALSGCKGGVILDLCCCLRFEPASSHELPDGAPYHQSTLLNLSLALGFFVKQRKLGNVDPELECVKVYRRTDGGYDRIAELTREAGDSLTTPLLEDLDIPLADGT